VVKFFIYYNKKTSPAKGEAFTRQKRLVAVYEQIGGQKVIDQIVDDFYRIMQTDPKAARCYATHHGRDIADSAKKLKAFLSGWTGGPQTYLETYGHPRLRMRHAPFAIGQEEAREWLYCMSEALKKSHLDEELQLKLLGALSQVAAMLVVK